MEPLLENAKKSLIQLYARLKDLYLSMTFGNRVVASLLMATLFISLGYLIVGSIKPADPSSKTVKLYNGRHFNFNEMRAAENAIADANLGNAHQWIADQLLVPVSKQAAYVAAFAKAEVLERRGTARQSAADSLSAWQSQYLMNKKMTTAAERDCADAIKLVPGIADATVISAKRNAWEINVWARTQIASVGVFVEAIDNRPLSPDTIGAIGQIVKPIFGITDMQEISIVDIKNSRAYDGTGEQQGSTQSEYQRHQLRHEEEWDQSIAKQLPAIPGLKVKTSVTLTTYRKSKSFNVEHDRPTPLVTHELDYHFKKEGWDRFFRPGQVAQWSRPLIDPTGNVSPKDLIDEKKREMETTNALPGTETQEEKLPYIPREIRVAIQVPRDYILSIWKDRNRRLGGLPDAVPTPEDLRAEEEEFATDQKQNVAKLLEPYRISNKIDPTELINITYYDRLLPEKVELTAWEQFVLFLKQNWQNLSLMSLVFGGLVVMWAISKPQKPEPIVIYEGLDTPLEAIDARIAEKRRLEEEARRLAEEAAAEEQKEFENSLGELGSIRSLREEIAELIAKNPEAAAAVIRQWIGNAVLVEAKT